MGTIDTMVIRAGQIACAVCLATNGILQLYYGDFRPQILPPCHRGFLDLLFPLGLSA